MHPRRILVRSCLIAAALALAAARGAAASNGTWTSFTTSGFPTSRGTLIAADPVGHRVFLYGPQTSESSCGATNDAYILDMTTTPPVYQPLSAVGPAPEPRDDAVMVFDPVRRRLLLIGGWSCVTSLVGTEVWELSLEDPPRWRRLDPLGAIPGPRYSHVAIYDPVRDRVIVYGGTRRDGVAVYELNDVWALNLSPEPTWSHLSPAGAEPPALFGALGAYDSRRDRLVLYGGGNGNTVNLDTWALTLSGIPTWSLLDTDGLPPSLPSRTSAVYDSLSDRLYTVGSEFGTVGGQVGTLDLASGRWDTLATTGPSPCPIVRPSTVLVAGERRLVTIGGSNFSSGLRSDAFALDLDTGTWTDLEAIGAMPVLLNFVPRSPTVALDSSGGRVIALSETPARVWVLRLENPPTWQRPVQIGNPPPTSTSIFWDEARQRVLAATPGALWELELDPTPVWSAIPPAGPAPGPRSGYSILYDSKRSRFLLFGGYASNGFVNELWELRLDPSPQWNLLSASGPAPRQRAALGYDPAGDRLVLFGGQSSTVNFYDLWTWPLDSDSGWQLAGNNPIYNYGSFVYDYRASRFLYSGNGIWALTLDPTPVWTQLPGGADGPAFLDPLEDRLVFPLSSSGGRALSFAAASAPPGLDCPPAGTWSPGSIRNVSFAATDLAGTGLSYEYVLTCSRNWPAFPVRGLVPARAFSKVYVPVGLPVPDTAAIGPVNFDLQVLAREQPSLKSTCSFTLTGEPSPIVVSQSGAQPDRAWVRWYSQHAGLEATVERRTESGPWTAVVRSRADAGGSIAYEDHDVQPDRRYYYRVAIADPGNEGTYGEIRIDVPRWSLGFASDQPNPMRGRFAVQCLVPVAGQARLEAFDVMGRRRFDAIRSVPQASRVTFELDSNGHLPAGIYFLRLAQAGEMRKITIVLLR